MLSFRGFILWMKNLESIIRLHMDPGYSVLRPHSGMTRINMNTWEKTKKSLFIIPPYLFGVFFIVLPLLIIFKISFSSTSDSLSLPYNSTFSFDSNYLFTIKIYFKHYVDLITNDFYLYLILSSFKIAILSTFFAFILGYLIALGISTISQKYRLLMLILVMLPFFTSFLMRVYAWITMLSTYGIINNCLLYFGLIQQPLKLLDSTFAVCIGTVYCYLPFMILPIYISLENIDSSFLEAAEDLGAKPLQSFYRIILPLSANGILGGCALVFIPVIGEFVIPELLGGSKTVTLGRAIFWEFVTNYNWPRTCAMAMLTIIILVLPIIILQREKNA